jgi:hypothetical protein
MELVEALLAIVRAVSWDQGEAILDVLKVVLAEHAPFDAGEVAILGPIGFDRFLLSGPSFAGEDLLLEARRRGGTLGIDDILETHEFPRTRAFMEQHGLRSLLALPLSEAGGVEGWIVLARDYGWAFCGVPLRLLEPVAAMTGLALARARALTALHRRFPVLVPAGGGAHSLTPEGGRETGAGALPAEASGEERTPKDPMGGEKGAPASLQPSVSAPQAEGNAALGTGTPRFFSGTRAERRAQRRARAQDPPKPKVPGSEPPKTAT